MNKILKLIDKFYHWIAAQLFDYKQFDGGIYIYKESYLDENLMFDINGNLRNKEDVQWLV